MKKDVLSLFIFFLLSVSGWSQTYQGSGTSLDPYKIQNVNDLAQLSKDVSAGRSYVDTCFILTNDLDFAGWDGITMGKVGCRSVCLLITVVPFVGNLTVIIM